MTLLVRGIALPKGESCSFWIDGGVLREEPAQDAELVVDGGWLLPGLVDVHTHPGAAQPGDPFEEAVLRGDLADHAKAGVLLIPRTGSRRAHPRVGARGAGDAALGAASWTARSWLGLPGLADGAPADLVA